MTSHLHVHVVPREPGDFADNDFVYTAIDEWSPVEGETNRPPAIDIPPDEQRTARTEKDMAAEAARYMEAFGVRGGGRGVGIGPDDAPQFGKFKLVRPLLASLAAARFAFRSVPSQPTLALFPHRLPLCTPTPQPPRQARTQVFYTSPSNLTMAVVNLKPLAPGHVLVVPRRAVPRMEELTPEEAADLWTSVVEVQRVVEKVHGADASNLGVQDGRGAGQSVPHVHVHILPRASHSASL